STIDQIAKDGDRRKVVGCDQIAIATRNQRSGAGDLPGRVRPTASRSGGGPVRFYPVSIRQRPGGYIVGKVTTKFSFRLQEGDREPASRRPGPDQGRPRGDLASALEARVGAGGDPQRFAGALHLDSLEPQVAHQCLQTGRVRSGNEQKILDITSGRTV